MNAPVPKKAPRAAIPLEVKFHKPGNKKQADMEQIKDSVETAEADAESLQLSKKMLKSPEYQAIRSHDRETKKHLRRHCLPSLTRDSIYLIPFELVEETDAYLITRMAERKVLVGTFIDIYPQQIEEAKKLLGKFFDRDDYPAPERVKAAFSVDIAYRSFDVDSALEKLNVEVFKREQERVKKDWTAMLEETKKYLRVNMVEFVARFAQSLETKSDGTKRKVYDSTVENLNEFLKLFEIRDISNDTQLQAVVVKVKALMKGVAPDAIRDDDAFRTKLATEFTKVTEKLGTMVEDAPVLRKILKKKSAE